PYTLSLHDALPISRPAVRRKLVGFVENAEDDIARVVCDDDPDPSPIVFAGVSPPGVLVRDDLEDSEGDNIEEGRRDGIAGVRRDARVVLVEGIPDTRRGHRLPQRKPQRRLSRGTLHAWLNVAEVSALLSAPRPHRDASSQHRERG